MRKFSKTILAKDLSIIDRASLAPKKSIALNNFIDNQSRLLAEANVFRSRQEKLERIVRFDQYDGTLWAGRFVGNIPLNDEYSLRIDPKEPEFFETMVQEVYGLRFLKLPGGVDATGFYSWQLIRSIFYGQLLKVYAKSLPLVRVSKTCSSQFLTGKMIVAATSRSLARGKIVSDVSERIVSPPIASLIVRASKILEAGIRESSSNKSIRANGVVDIDDKRIKTALLEFNNAYNKSSKRQKIQPIRYTALSMGYKGVVELAQMIIELKIGSGVGSKKNLTVLFDIAEIWEYFCLKFLQKEYLDHEIVHCAQDNVGYLDKTQLFGLKPDFLIMRLGKIVAVADAKYKLTSYKQDRMHGTSRDDIYQMNAYLNSDLGSEWEQPVKTLLLLYPDFKSSKSVITKNKAVLRTSEHDHIIRRCLIDEQLNDVLFTTEK